MKAGWHRSNRALISELDKKWDGAIGAGEAFKRSEAERRSETCFRSILASFPDCFFPLTPP
jgi:hypothetical protein